MAVHQPLASSLHDVPDATLKGTVHVHGPDVRRVHAALDACADESGPMRFEEVRFAQLPGRAGSVWLLGKAPSPALSQLISAAPGVGHAFGGSLGLPLSGQAPEGRLAVTGGLVVDRPDTVRMSVFLAMLERDPQITPSSLENLFDGLEAPREAGLVVMDAGSIGLTPDGRKMISDAGGILDAASEESIGTIDLYAQDVADGRMTLRGALRALGEELSLALPEPGEEVEADDIYRPGALVRSAADGLRPIVEAAQAIPESHRLDVVVAGLVRALVELGVDENPAADRVRNDLRLLRLLGASLSHGLPTLEGARRRLIPEHEAMIDLFHTRLGGDATHHFLLERVIEADECVPEPPAEPQGWFRRLLKRIGIA